MKRESMKNRVITISREVGSGGRGLLPLTVDLHDALGAERQIRMDKDLQAVGLVLQDVIGAAADDDAGPLFGKLADDAALNFP